MSNKPKKPISLELLKPFIESMDATKRLNCLNHIASKQQFVAEMICEFILDDIAHRKLFVRLFSGTPTQTALEAGFAEYGEIEEASIIYDHITGKPKGFGFVTFKNPDSAQQALITPLKNIDGIMCEVSYVSTSKEYDHIVGGSSNTLPMPNPNPPHSNLNNHPTSNVPTIQAPLVNAGSRTNSMFIPTNHIVRRGSGHLPHDIGTPSVTNRYVVNNNFPQYCNSANILSSFSDAVRPSANNFDPNHYVSTINTNNNFNTSNNVSKWITQSNNNWNNITTPYYGHNPTQYSHQQFQHQYYQQQQYIPQNELPKPISSPSSMSSASSGSDNYIFQAQNYSAPDISNSNTKHSFTFWRSPGVVYPSSATAVIPTNANSNTNANNNINGNRN